MLFVVSTLVTLGALWVLYTWATEAFPWLARTPRRKRSLAGVLAFLVVANWISVAVLAAVPVALLRAVSRVAARDGAGAIEPAPAGPITRRQIVEGIGGAAL